MRTFSRADLDGARAAWDGGSFSDEWVPFRERAARVGMLWPPKGGPLDSWDVAHPSQRAILVQAIRDAPAMLAECIDASSSWGDVIARLTASQDRRVPVTNDTGAAAPTHVRREGTGTRRTSAGAEATRRRIAELQAIGPGDGRPIADHGVSDPGSTP